MDNEDRKYSLGELEKYSYRNLQQIAKSLSLPSNVKKVHLIQMIHTKKFKTNDELNIIIQRVKRERLQVSQAKKKGIRKKSNLQGMEISSTSNSLSPPITFTPKHGNIMLRCSQQNLQRAMSKNNPRQTHFTRNTSAIRKTYPSPKKSDRVLRSFNIKTTKKDANTTVISPKNLINNDVASSDLNINRSMYSILKSNQQHILDESQEQRFPNIMSENCVVNNPDQNFTFVSEAERNQLPVTRNASTCPMVPAKRQRLLSGIYPLVPKEPPKVNYGYPHSVGLRHQDGKISKINALVQKRSDIHTEVTAQDLINGNITQSYNNPGYVNPLASTSLTYSTMNPEQRQVIDQRNMRQADTNYSDSLNLVGHEHPLVYCHKKIRGDQVRTQRFYQREVVDRLPKINDVFSRFNSHMSTDVTKPLYVQVNQEYAIPREYLPVPAPLLESVYNFRGQYVVHQPLLQIATTANTTCVYSTPVIATAVAQKSTATASSTASHLRDNYNSDLSGPSRFGELLKFGEQEERQRDFSDEETSSSLDDSQSQIMLPSSLPEMEDALELISQDGDYMERICMDEQTQCVLCSFVCAKFQLQYHIRKDHTNEIHEMGGSTSMFFFLRTVVARGREYRFLSQESILYLLTLNFADECLHATLHTLQMDTSPPKTGSITIYNELSNKEYSWEGEIHTLPDTDYNQNADGLKIKVSRLRLMTLNATLKPLNHGLIFKLPQESVNHPNSNDVGVKLDVNIFDIIQNAY